MGTRTYYVISSSFLFDELPCLHRCNLCYCACWPLWKWPFIPLFFSRTHTKKNHTRELFLMFFVCFCRMLFILRVGSNPTHPSGSPLSAGVPSQFLHSHLKNTRAHIHTHKYWGRGCKFSTLFLLFFYFSAMAAHSRPHYFSKKNISVFLLLFCPLIECTSLQIALWQQFAFVTSPSVIFFVPPLLISLTFFHFPFPLFFSECAILTYIKRANFGNLYRLVSCTSIFLSPFLQGCPPTMET